MKILIDARLYGLENAGLGRYAVNLIDQIVKLDKKNDYVLLLRKKYFDNLDLPKNFKKVLVDFRHYSFREQILLSNIITAEKPDLTHFLHFNVPITFQGRFVVTIHDLLMHKQKGLDATTLNPAFYFLKRLGYKKVFSNAVKKAERIIVPSNFVKEDIVKTYKIEPEKVVVTYEGVDLERFNKNVNDEKILKKYNLKPQNYFLYLGNAYPHKNLKRAVEAAMSSRSILAISSSRSVFFERLEKLISSLNAEEYVKLLGFVPDEEIVALYRNSIGFLYPSVMEGFGLQGLEAMQLETLVLASEIPVFKEIYKDHAIYFNPFDFSNISQKMEFAKDLSPEKRKIILTKAKEFSSTYSWKKMFEETLEVYSQL